MLKLSCPSIIKPLLIIFRKCLKFETLPDYWKKSSVVPVHKKDNKQIVNNYWSVSLLSICFKVFEKLIFDAIFEFMIESNLLSSTQALNQKILVLINLFQ